MTFWPQNPFLGKFGAKKSKLSIKLKIDTHGISEVQIPNPNVDFWNSIPKIHFWANLGWKSQSFPFFLKIGTHGISTMLILVPPLVFWISNPKSFFGKIWTEKVKVVQFGWKLAHRVSRRCWFFCRHYFSQFPTLNLFLDKFGLKNSQLFILTKNWHAWYIEDADFYFDNIFLTCQP